MTIFATRKSLIRLAVIGLWLLGSVVIRPLRIAAVDWPAFRGPDGNGHAASADFPLQWSATKNVTWRTPIPGNGWSSPVIVDGKLYLTSAVPIEDSDDRTYSLRTLCLDAKQGDILWDVEVFQEGADAPRIHAKNSHASPTPLVDGDHVFVHFGHQGTACLSVEGKIIWKNDTLKYPPTHGNGGTPILTDNLLIFSCDGAENPFVVALDAKTGNVTWRVPRTTDEVKKFSFSTPTLITVKGQPQVVSPGSGVVCAYDPNDGREIWRVRYDGYSVIPKPLFSNGLLYVCTGYNDPSLLAIRVGGEGDLTDSNVVWTITKKVPNTPSPLIVDKELYMVSDGGIASCLDALTGKVYWEHRLGGNFSASPVYARGKILYLNETGDGYIIEPARKFKQLAQNSLGEATLASPAIVEQTLFIRTDKHLYRIEKKTDN